MKATRIDMLAVGQMFMFPHAPDTYRGLYVSNIGDCSVTIKGEHLVKDVDGNGKWMPLGANYTISAESPVIPVQGSHTTVKKRGRGRPKGSKNKPKNILFKRNKK